MAVKANGAWFEKTPLVNELVNEEDRELSRFQSNR
jgi:hypothetical protein